MKSNTVLAEGLGLFPASSSDQHSECSSEALLTPSGRLRHLHTCAHIPSPIYIWWWNRSWKMKDALVLENIPRSLAFGLPCTPTWVTIDWQSSIHACLHAIPPLSLTEGTWQVCRSGSEEEVEESRTVQFIQKSRGQDFGKGDYCHRHEWVPHNVVSPN